MPNLSLTRKGLWERGLWGPKGFSLLNSYSHPLLVLNLLPSPSFLGPLPHRPPLAAEPSDRTADRGAGVPGLHAAHVSTMYGPGPCSVHLPTLLWSW